MVLFCAQFKMLNKYVNLFKVNKYVNLFKVNKYKDYSLGKKVQGVEFSEDLNFFK